MKILLITDQHFGVRNDNQNFIDHYKRFYGEVVLPYIDAHNIKDVICLGDTFDKRRSINFMSLEAAKDMWFTPLQDRGVTMDMLVGNHDIYYKNTLRVNAPSELLGEYNNINVITEPTTAVYDGLPILLLPWICDENRTEVLEKLRTTEAKVCMGHLELNGFEAHPGHFMQNGMDAKHFSKFDYVVSQLQDMGLGDLKIIEDLGVEVNDSKVVETEDTMTLLDNYIDGIDLKVNKSNIKNVMRSLYMEAAEI